MNRRNPASAVVSHGILWVAVLFSAFPFYWMIITSFSASSGAFSVSSIIWPQQWGGFDNYATAITETPILRYMLNGAIVCTGILIAQIATALPLAYALAKLKFRGKTLLAITVILCLAVPFQALSLPLFVGMAHLKLLNTFFALMAPFFVSFLAILILTQFLRGYPDEILEAARLDGLSEAAILWRLILPASKPAIAAFSVFSVTGHWNDLYWPLIVVSSPELAPPTLGILYFRSDEGGDSVGPLMAAGTLVTIPLILLFSVAQRKFVQGITMTGLK